MCRSAMVPVCRVTSSSTTSSWSDNSKSSQQLRMLKGRACKALAARVSGTCKLWTCTPAHGQPLHSDRVENTSSKPAAQAWPITAWQSSLWEGPILCSNAKPGATKSTQPQQILLCKLVLLLRNHVVVEHSRCAARHRLGTQSQAALRSGS